VIVVDASVLVTALADDGADGRRARWRLRGERLSAPAVVDLEVLAALRRLATAGRLGSARADQAIADLRSVRVARIAHKALLSRCWELRANLTVYDAAYVALAEAFDAVLVTADGRLAGAPALRCTVEVLR
jgi:predicted nucleic acid-binding protein